MKTLSKVLFILGFGFYVVSMVTSLILVFSNLDMTQMRLILNYWKEIFIPAVIGTVLLYFGYLTWN